jgi:hypothetical protein
MATPIGQKNLIHFQWTNMKKANYFLIALHLAEKTNQLQLFTFLLQLQRL